ncbi:phytoene desaturase family protein [Actinomadura macrotermitis]|uniref:All-trans-zeta-carotene desaturase n=1 Tax=Actinomadura macrotermitis TaxID=2585200 RepID=A0A7K0C471_9ACTN|nr:NAD(P)/FAD-dependent oxidoreductase [Actinomadura macrotermitis]MQY07902.1 All-trans-zeta-carotene desaturase [Actinomadura macrotermitis]
MTSSDESYDAVVVGAGIGGLVCASYLAVAGLRVLVAERHTVAGGNGQVFRRRGRYEFDVGVHYLGDCGPGGVIPAILAGLGADGRVAFLPLEPDGFDRVLLPGLTVDVPVGWDRYLDRLTAALPAEAPGITRCVRTLEALAAALRGRSLSSAAPSRSDVDLLRTGAGSLAGLFAACGLSARAGTLLAAQSGNYGAPPSGTSATAHAAMIDHYLRGAYYPAGGGQLLPATLVEVIEAHGGEVRTRCPVRRVTTGGGRATGVVLDDGTAVRAPVVVSNADYRHTVLELCADAALPRPLVDRTRDATMRAAAAVLYVALDRPLDIPNANLWWWRDADAEAAYRALGTGEPPMAFLSFASVKDPGARAVCPPGHANFQVMTLVPPAPPGPPDYRRDPGYLAAKDRLTAELLDIAEELLGPLRAHVVHLETATARTNRRFTGGSGGTPFGLGDWGGVHRRPDVRTSVDGLYVAGQDTRYGSGIVGAAVSGITAAGRVLGRDLLPEVHAGAVLGDPARLPARGAAFDPLQVSRGSRRTRGARATAAVGGPGTV